MTSVTPIPAPEPRRLDAAALRRRVDPSGLSFRSTEELSQLEGIIGQERATRAVRFGLGIEAPGYNIFALGPAGAGRTTTIRRYLRQIAARRPTPPDWIYVFNFEDPDEPLAIRLPAGRGALLRQRVDELLRDVVEQLPQAFETEHYQEHRSRLIRKFQKQRESLLEEARQFAQAHRFTILETPMGLALAPIGPDGKPLPPDQYEALPPHVKAQLDAVRDRVEEVLERTVRQIHELEKQLRRALVNLDRDVAASVLAYLFDDVRQEFSDIPEVVRWLDASRQDMIDNIHMLRQVLAAMAQMTGGTDVPPSLPMRHWEDTPLSRYTVNLLVDHRKTEGAPVIYEPNPTVYNLVGKQEYKARFGALLTDFTMLRAGALHKANGGYLVLNIVDLLRQPLAWDALKRALKTSQVVIEDIPQQLGFLPAVGLRPKPIPLDIKVVLIGEPMYYYLLYALDEDFPELFKVRADFSPDMPWTPEHVQDVARFVHTLCQEENIPHFTVDAVAELVMYAGRLASSQKKLTARFGLLADIVREAGYWAGERGHTLVEAEDVRQAIEERAYRSRMWEERILELILDHVIYIDTEGKAVGQVNGLSVITLGDYTFGRPNRITARVSLGQAGVINIEREVKLSGRIHDKGVLILSGFMAGRYAQDKPLSLSATLTFEQSYEGVEGDSASAAELYAILSALSGLPLRQDIAVTGSVNQRGQIQPVGGVNEKIEGFFAVCKARGLTGQQGVIIPATNVQHLMLREEVIEAVEAGQFHIYPIRTVDEGLEILTGVAAGQRRPDGTWPEGTVNWYVDRRLRQMAMRLRQFGRTREREGEKEQKGNEEGEETPPEPPKEPPTPPDVPEHGE